MLAVTIVFPFVAESPELMPTIYPSEQEAAIAALKQSYEWSNQYEYGGTILRTSTGDFVISRPETNFRGDSVHINFNAADGYTVVGSYHTHACLPYSHWPNVFSDADVLFTDRHAVRGYMADLCSGVIRVYDPNIDLHNRCWFNENDPDEPPSCGSYGREISKFPITRQPVMQEIPGPITRARGILGW